MVVTTPNIEDGDDHSNPLADADVNPNIEQVDQAL